MTVTRLEFLEFHWDQSQLHSGCYAYFQNFPPTLSVNAYFLFEDFFLGQVISTILKSMRSCSHRHRLANLLTAGLVNQPLGSVGQRYMVWRNNRWAMFICFGASLMFWQHSPSPIIWPYQFLNSQYVRPTPWRICLKNTVF